MVRDIPNGEATKPRWFTIILGTVAGELDPILTGEEAVWVKLAPGVKPIDVMDAEVFVRVKG